MDLNWIVFTLSSYHISSYFFIEIIGYLKIWEITEENSHLLDAGGEKSRIQVANEVTFIKTFIPTDVLSDDSLQNN